MGRVWVAQTLQDGALTRPVANELGLYLALGEKQLHGVLMHRPGNLLDIFQLFGAQDCLRVVSAVRQRGGTCIGSMSRGLM